MVQVLNFRDPEDARRRLIALGVTSPDAAAILRDLRPYLIRAPLEEGAASDLASAVSRRGVTIVKGEGAVFFSVSSDEEVARWREAGFPCEVLHPVREALARFLRRDFAVPCRGRTLLLSGRPRLMGILNVTPDSFSDGGRYLSTDEAVRRGMEMAREGADIIDVGGESTRPGAAPVPEDTERRRVVPVIRALAGETDALISVDTTKACVASDAVAAGAHIVNDTSALADDPAMAEVVRVSECAVVLMHRRGTPATMQQDPSYRLLIPEILAELGERVAAAEGAGIPEGRILVDPGIGFGKRFGDNLSLHRRLVDLRNLGKPILFGPSRKSFIGTITGEDPQDRVFGTAASVAWAAAAGAHVIRVHDVKAMREVVLVTAAIGDGAQW
jgi:dihydropteroate synthase